MRETAQGLKVPTRELLRCIRIAVLSLHDKLSGRARARARCHGVPAVLNCYRERHSRLETLEPL